ncbi:DUF6297 family protein [Sphaerisporangium rhizosphaerae]|uniref:DUF6297 family protein n=1 Tax=Sphaerisporangium rhizosphaerae TaxID=2269375 RepID=A0ABW2P2G8_9ACTN
MTVVDDAPGRVPKARDLRGRRRSGRPRRPLAYTLSSLLERGLYLVVLGALIVEVVSSGLERVERGGAPPESVRTSVTQLTAALLAILCVVLLAKALLAFGPLQASASARTWLLSTPVDRGALLSSHLSVALAIGSAVSAALGYAFLAVTRLSVPLVPWFTPWAAFGAVVTCLCVLVQAGHRSARAVQRGLSVMAYALTGVAAAILVLRPGYPLADLEEAGTAGYAVCAVASLVVAVIAVRLARRSLGLMTRGMLSSGSELAMATQVSVLSLDVTLFWAIVLERRARTIALVRPARISGNRLVALVRTDLARVRRMPTGLFIWAALICVPYGGHVVGLTAFLPALHTVTAFLAVDRLAGGLRIISRSPAIRRALGGSDRSLTLAHLVVPAAGALLWSGVTVALVPGVSVLTATVSAVGAVIVTYRVATRPPLDYASPMVDVGLFGPTPLGLILQLLRGPALLAGLSLLQTALSG